VTATLSVLALLVALGALALATVANRRWARRPRAGGPSATDAGPFGEDGAVSPQPQPAGRQELEDLAAGVEGLGALVDELRGRIEDVAAATSDIPPEPTALRHVAVVRYDAFADVGGRLSYSLAILDDTRSGVVLTTLAGKSDVRTYVRTVSAGAGDGTLTAEEQQAIEAAGSRP
jgi:hypothetical protein